MRVVEAIACVEFDPLNIGLMLAPRNGDVLVLAENLFAVFVPPDFLAVAERYSLAAILRTARQTGGDNLIPDSDFTDSRNSSFP